MNIEDAMKIIRRHAPCPHDMWESVGYNGMRKCSSCDEYMIPSESPKYIAEFDRFCQACDMIESLARKADEK